MVEDSGREGKGTYCRLVGIAAFMEDFLPVVFGAFVLHGSVKRGEGGEDVMVIGDSCCGKKEIIT